MSLPAKMTFHSEPPAGYSFTEAGHIHRLGGVVLPSVTEIIGHFKLGFDYTGIPAHIVEAAGVRGTAYHKAVRFGLESDLDWGSVDGQIKPNVEATLEFLVQAKAEPWDLEVPVVSLAYLFGGIPDFWGLVYDYPTVLDLKSGETKGIGLQTAGYATAKVESLLKEYHQKNLPKEILQPRRLCLAASGGKVKPIWCEDPLDAANFLACSRVWHLQEAGR